MDNLLQGTMSAHTKLDEFNDQVRLVISSIESEYELLSAEKKLKFDSTELGQIRHALKSFETTTLPQLIEHLSEREQYLKLYLFDTM